MHIKQNVESYNIYTSNFAKSAKHPKAISVARFEPEYYFGQSYKLLAPPAWLLKASKTNAITEKMYIKIYIEQVLNKLNPIEIAKVLNCRVLLCHCSKDKFCHRHLVVR